jgi:hypothetical protein
MWLVLLVLEVNNPTVGCAISWFGVIFLQIKFSESSVKFSMLWPSLVRL